MKHLFISLLFEFISLSTFSQQTYYDVLSVRDLISGNHIPHTSKLRLPESDSLKKILAPYVGSSPTDEEIKNSFSSNPFMSFDSGGPKSNNSIESIRESFSSIGGINVTNFADGVAKFLVERFKEELSMAFFDKLKKQMNDKRYSDLKILFPETWKTLMTIDEDIYQYSIYLNTLRESFKKDMTNEFVNLEKFLNQQKYRDFFNNKNPELGSILRTSLYLINGFSSGKHPGDVLAEFNPNTQIVLSPTNKNLQTNIRSSINTVQLISKSLRSQSESHYWVPADSVRLLFDKDLIAFKIYLGLIYQESQDISFAINGNPRSLQDILYALAPNVDSILIYKNYIETFIDNTEEINEDISAIKEKKKSDVDFNDYYKLFNSSLDLVGQASSFTELPFVNLYLDEAQRNNIKTNSDKLLFVARTAGDLYVDVRTKNYSSAVLNSVILIDTLLYKADAENKEKLKTLILKYGSFIAAVAQAENSDEVKKALESAALPSGSYSVKQKSAWNSSLNGYMGYNWDYKGGTKKDDLYAQGIYAPVGVTLSKGLSKKCGGAVTLFASIIDVGSIASYRLKNGMSDTLQQDIRLESIFTPGIQFYISVPKTPLVFGAGWRSTSKLFYSGGGEFLVVPSKDVFTLSVLVDIPIFNIYNRHYQK